MEESSEAFKLHLHCLSMKAFVAALVSACKGAPPSFPFLSQGP